jgi:hypothetical protein
MTASIRAVERPMLIKLLAFVAGVVFGSFPPELIAILITPSAGSRAARAREPSTGRGGSGWRPRRHRGHRGHPIYRNPRRWSG